MQVFKSVSTRYTDTVWLLLFLVFPSGYLFAQEAAYFPPANGTWESAPRQLVRNVNVGMLEEAIDYAEENEYGGSRDLRQAILQGFIREPYHEILGPVKKRGGPAGVIIKDGYLLARWGDIDRVDMAFSVTKSFLSATAGLALDRGLIHSVNDSVSDYIWDGTFEGPHNGSIQWKHLLQQNSDWSGSLWGLHDWADRPPREGTTDDWRLIPPRPPGTVMEYNDVRVNVLAYALTHVWREPLPLVLRERLMDRLGCSTTWRWFGYDHAWTTIDGLRMKSVTGGGHSGGGMFINTPDMARFGLLFMNRGYWDGEQILSADWIEQTTAPSGPNSRYGFMWWLNRDAEGEWAQLSEKLFYAAGFGGNFIVVDQDSGLVVVCRWLEPGRLPTFLNKVYAAFE